ncbi:MAG: L-fuculokinase [Bacteroidaceae bacterium]
MRHIAIVFDCGATNVRVVAISNHGEILASKSLPNETDEDPNLVGGRIWDLDKLWNKLALASKEVMSKIDTKQIVGVTFTTFGVDGTFVDNKGNLLYPVVSWQCNRTESIVKRINKYISTERLYQLSGVFPYAFNTIYKMVWFKENHPELFKDAYRFLFIPSLLMNRLSDTLKNDATMMGTSMMSDLKKRQFSDEILGALNIDSSLFGEIGESGQQAGIVNEKGFDETYIPVGTPIFFAGHDTQFAVFGSGAKLNELVLSSGTWEILMGRSVVNQLKSVPLQSNLTRELDAEEGICNTGQTWLASGVLEWFFRQFYPNLTGDELYDTVAMEAEKVELGKSGITINPDFYKETDASQGGGIQGLTISTTRAEIYSALLESLSFRLREALESLQEACSFKATQIICVGGGSKNKRWNQLRADICQIPIKLIDQKETTVLGASFFIFAGVGLYASAEDSREYVDYNPQTITPNREKKEFWDEQYESYLKNKLHSK